MNASVTIRLRDLVVEEQAKGLAPPAQLQLTGAEVSDEALMARICAGDADALSCLFRRYGRLVRAAAYHVLRDISEADDLLQDIFLLIHRKCATFDSAKSPARFWILRMTYHR